MSEMMTYGEQEVARRERLAEVGTCPPCPQCGVPRVQRSDYIRCLRCGINWLDQEMHLPNYLNQRPDVARHAVRMAARVSKPAAPMATDVKADEAAGGWRSAE